jgi:hypothetical protein
MQAQHSMQQTQRHEEFPTRHQAKTAIVAQALLAYPQNPTRQKRLVGHLCMPPTLSLPNCTLAKNHINCRYQPTVQKKVRPGN